MNPPPIWADLYAPRSYIEATDEQREAVCNGCGPAGWKFDVVPDNLYGLDIRIACDIHDWMYHEGKTHADKEEADRVFLNNLTRLVNAETQWGWLRWARRRMARRYYLAVHHFGGGAFWDGKNRPEDVLSVKV